MMMKIHHHHLSRKKSTDRGISFREREKTSNQKKWLIRAQKGTDKGLTRKGDHQKIEQKCLAQLRLAADQRPKFGPYRFGPPGALRARQTNRQTLL